MPPDQVGSTTSLSLLSGFHPLPKEHWAREAGRGGRGIGWLAGGLLGRRIVGRHLNLIRILLAPPTVRVLTLIKKGGLMSEINREER